MTADEQKKAAAEAALDHVRSGMKLGLGTGSTARHFVEGVGRLVKQGYDLTCVPTSEQTRNQAQGLGIKLSSLDETPMLDLTVDGADEFDGDLNLIKGGGGALLREKIVATSSKRMIVIADASKQVETLGVHPLPIEVIPFGLKPTVWKIDAAFKHLKMQGAMTLRLRDGKPFVTDSGNAIVDCAMKRIDNPQLLAALLSGIPGIVDHGLFIGIAELAIIGTPDGVRTVERKQ